MKTFAAIVALAISATARLTERGDDTKCCFTLTAHGGTSGSVGQLDDGQTRVGGGYPPSHFCLTNGGGITDGNGRGCILTPPTTQLQCDVGATPTEGFEVNSQGELTHKGSSHFVACEATKDEYNIYTNPDESDVSGCVDITLTANGCAPKPPKTVTETQTKTQTVTSCSATTQPTISTQPTTPAQPPPATTQTQTQPTMNTQPTTTPQPVTTHTQMQPTTTKPASTSCPTNLSGNYEFPHLIVPIDSAHPDTAKGTSYFGTISDTVSTIFNFDIPPEDKGKTCSLIFLFPEQSDLQTSSYTFSGDGKIDVSKLKSPATAKTTFDNAPSSVQDYGVTKIAPGNSYLIATFDCPANQRVGFEVSSAGTTDLHYFQDYNPAPIGLYITTC